MILFPLSIIPSQREKHFLVLLGDHRILAECDGLRKAKFIQNTMNVQADLLKVATKMMNHLLKVDYKTWGSREVFDREMIEYSVALQRAQVARIKAEKNLNELGGGVR